MRTKYKPWALPYINEHSEVMFQEEEFSLINDNSILEIGSGKGGFILDMSLKFPNKNFIGIERNVTCCGFCAKKLVENKITNAKLFFGDFEKISSLIMDGSIETIFLNFSDPWPKKRHYKRRLTATKFLNEYYRILKKGGRLIFKTDNKDLFEFSNETLMETSFKVISYTEDYKELDEFDSITEYEKSFRDEGLPIYRMVLEK